jgi:Helix-turn-helix domain
LRTPAGDEILRGVDGDPLRGHSRPEDADTSGESGWVTTEVAAKAVRVSPRTIRRYIERGELEAKPQGEGVNRTWLVSVTSLYALRASRTVEDERPQDVRVAEPDSMADVYRDLATRLEHRAEEAAELRTRLELTERTQSTLEEEAHRLREERDRLRAELEAERSKGFWSRLFGP